MEKNIPLLGVGFLAGTICSVIAFKLLTNIRKTKQQNQPLTISSKKNSAYLNNPNSAPSQYQSDPEYQQLKNEQLARIIKFFGEEKFKKLENSFVIVFGVGGVGSHVVNMLARSGVKRIRIIDFDTVSMSSLNRHSFAVREDVGTPKVECMKKYIKKIFPHLQIQSINVYVTVENVRKLLINNLDEMNKALSNTESSTSNNKQHQKIPQSQKPSYIVDCIDNLDAKVQLISACVQNSLKLIVSGGAGMKADPTKLQIRDIADCKYDKLIMRIKRQLTKKSIKSGIKVCYSYQQSEKQLLPLTETQQQNPQAFKVFDNYRIRIIPVLGTMPAIIGMAISSYVLCELAGQPYEPFETDYVKSSGISKLYNELLYEVKRRGCRPDYLRIDIQQASILAKKVYAWKCLIHPQKKGERLSLWDRNKPGIIDNFPLMCKQCYDKHNKLLTPEDGKYSPQVYQRFEQRSKYARDLWNSGYMMFI